jgi:hypothetical protein
MKWLRCSSWYTALLFIASVVMHSCVNKPVYENPEGYDFSRPERIFMKEDLLEISGITFHHDNIDSAFAVNDEQGKVYRFKSLKKKPDFVRFGKQGDYEDIAAYKRFVFVLRSDGQLFSFSLDSIRDKEVTSRRWKDLLPKGEYEGMFIHEAESKLYVLCKACEKEKKYISGFEFDLVGDSVHLVNTFSIDTRDLREKYGMKWGFRPSALAWNKSTREWYIISSVNKMLLITDSGWDIKKEYELNPKVFIQPEGIAFDANRNLYVSNEGNETRNGNVVRFMLHPEK